MNCLPDIFGRRKIKKLQCELESLHHTITINLQNYASDSKWYRGRIEKLEHDLSTPKALSVPSNWLTDNVLELRAFLKTPTGQLLIQRARAMEYNRALANANDVMHTQHSAGVTVGINGTLNWIESLASDQVLQNLSGPTADQVGKTDTASGDHDDAALVEKFSP